MNKILVKVEDYKKYTSKYNTDKLSDKYIIYTNSSFPKFVRATGSKKDNIYQYMMRFISGWEKRDTDQYPLGWAIYFRI